MKVEYTVVSVPSCKGSPSEDAYLVEEGDPFFAAIADGHGFSPRVPAFAQRVVECLCELVMTRSNAFGEAFDATAERVTEEFCGDVVGKIVPRIGAVASCLTVVEGKIHLAQAGDCRLYVAMDFSQGFTRLTQDHSCHHAGERERLQPHIDRGSFLIWPPFMGEDETELPRRRLSKYEGEELIVGILPTRGFGDWFYTPALTHHPEVQSFELSAVPQGSVFALCSDGGNRYVERVFAQISGESTKVPLADLDALTRPHLAYPSDDVTIIYFRPVS
jgi:serine/threonine protein phosphatase PrpC